jgi:hypothetical protein
MYCYSVEVMRSGDERLVADIQLRSNAEDAFLTHLMIYNKCDWRIDRRAGEGCWFYNNGSVADGAYPPQR